MNSMGSELNPFEKVSSLLADTSVRAPQGRFSTFYNERGVFNHNLEDGTRIHMSFANEGGAQGVHGVIIGRIHISPGHTRNWDVFELYPDERVWNFNLTETNPGIPVTTNHWLDASELEELHAR